MGHSLLSPCWGSEICCVKVTFPQALCGYGQDKGEGVGCPQDGSPRRTRSTQKLPLLLPSFLLLVSGELAHLWGWSVLVLALGFPMLFACSK